MRRKLKGKKQAGRRGEPVATSAKTERVNKKNVQTPDKGNLRLISDVYQPELGSESVDLHTGAVPGDEAGPDGRKGWCMVVTLVRGRRRVCQSGISDGQKDGRNRDGFLYSDRRSTTEKGAVRCQLGRWEEEEWG